jgi:FkbM family methyltransferase
MSCEDDDSSSLLLLQTMHELRTLENNQQTGDLQKPILGQCLKAVDRRQLEYDSAGFQQVTETDAIRAPTQILELSGGPWMGIYNPSIVKLPASIQPHVSPRAKFAMSARRDLHQCNAVAQNSHAPAIPESLQNTSGAFFLLDGNYCVVDERPLLVAGSVNRLAQDVRLFVKDGELQASFVMWQYGPSGTQGRGLWLAPLKTMQDSVMLDTSRGVRLGTREEKNYGLFEHGSRTMALAWLYAKAQRPSPLPVLGYEFGSHSGLSKERTPSEKSHRWHNSANLLQLQSGEFLGIMHVHTDSVPNTKLLYGHEYRQKFFKLSRSPPFAITAVGEPFCMQDSAGECETIQNVMSVLQTSEDEVRISFGANDCESKFAVYRLSKILQQLSPTKQALETTVVQVSEVQPHLIELAEMLSPSPYWPYGDESVKATAYAAGLLLQHRLPLADFYDFCGSVVGPYGDWPVCKSWLSSECVVYDFGIANEWGFSDSMAEQHGCEVHSFDPSDGHLEQHKVHRHDNVSFHFLGLSNGESKSLEDSWIDSQRGYGTVIGLTKRLDTIMSSLGHRAIDVLKIDCEGCEGDALAAVSPEAMACVQVLMLELHFAERFQGSDSSLKKAAQIHDHLHATGWKTWFSVQRGWGPDESVQPLPGWSAAGGDSCCYNVGFINTRFDANICPSPKV